MRTVRWTASVAALALVSACAAGPTDGDATDAGAATAPQAVDGHDLLGFTGRQLDGGDFDGAEVTGDVLVWFWAPW